MAQDLRTGILQSDRDRDCAKLFDEEFGLRELRAKVNGKTGIKYDMIPNAFSISAEDCYGTGSIETMRKYLDSGLLQDYFDARKDNKWEGTDAYRFVVLCAGAMSLGCTLAEETKERLKKMLQPAHVDVMKQKRPDIVPTPKARAQLKKALAEYEVGKPYNYGNKTFLESYCTDRTPGVSEVKDVGPMRFIRVTQAHGRKITNIFGPRTDEELGLVKIFPNQMCATCGADKQPDGKELLKCNKCQDRKYCGKACQKKHWKYHKTICKLDAEKMRQFMDSVPLPVATDKDAVERAMNGL